MLNSAPPKPLTTCLYFPTHPPTCHASFTNSMPPSRVQITVELKVPLSGYQALMYAWIQATNTKRMPEEELNAEGRLLGFAA